MLNLQIKIIVVPFQRSQSLLVFLLHDFCILSISVAFGVAVAFPWWMAGAPLHRAGEDQEEPIFAPDVLQQWDRQSAAQTERGGRVRTAALVGPSDHDRDWGVRRRRGCHLHDSQSPQCCHPGFLHVLLLPNATGVCVLHTHIYKTNTHFHLLSWNVSILEISRWCHWTMVTSTPHAGYLFHHLLFMDLFIDASV